MWQKEEVMLNLLDYLLRIYIYNHLFLFYAILALVQLFKLYNINSHQDLW